MKKLLNSLLKALLKVPSLKRAFCEVIPVTANVQIRGIDRYGKIIFEDIGHNVFTNAGREWLADNFAVQNTVPWTRKVNTVPYYLAVGQGSDQQTITPPGPGTQSETAVVTHLEDSVLVTAGVYLHVLDRPTTEPDATSNRYIATLDETEVSFGAITSVPVTEFGLITSDAVPTTQGGYDWPTYDNGKLIAYRAIPPITKTQLFKLQVLWDLRW